MYKGYVLMCFCVFITVSSGHTDPNIPGLPLLKNSVQYLKIKHFNLANFLTKKFLYF